MLNFKCQLKETNYPTHFFCNIRGKKLNTFTKLQQFLQIIYKILEVVLVILPDSQRGLSVLHEHSI